MNRVPDKRTRPYPLKGKPNTQSSQSKGKEDLYDDVAGTPRAIRGGMPRELASSVVSSSDDPMMGQALVPVQVPDSTQPQISQAEQQLVAVQQANIRKELEQQVVALQQAVTAIRQEAPQILTEYDTTLARLGARVNNLEVSTIDAQRAVTQQALDLVNQINQERLTNFNLLSELRASSQREIEWVHALADVFGIPHTDNINNLLADLRERILATRDRYETMRFERDAAGDEMIATRNTLNDERAKWEIQESNYNHQITRMQAEILLLKNHSAAMADEGDSTYEKITKELDARHKEILKERGIVRVLRGQVETLQEAIQGEQVKYEGSINTLARVKQEYSQLDEKYQRALIDLERLKEINQDLSADLVDAVNGIPLAVELGENLNWEDEIVETPAPNNQVKVELPQAPPPSPKLETLVAYGIDEIIPDLLVVPPPTVPPTPTENGVAILEMTSNSIWLESRSDRASISARHPPGSVFVSATGTLLIGGIEYPGHFSRSPRQVQFDSYGILINGVRTQYGKPIHCSLCGMTLKHPEIARAHIGIHNNDKHTPLDIQ